MVQTIKVILKVAGQQAKCNLIEGIFFMASYIQQGEKITASWLNSVVDAVNGQSIHTGNYINTPNGVVYKQTNTFNNEQTQTSYLHQCRYGHKTYDLVFQASENEQMIAVINRHIYMFLGRSLPAYINSFILPENMVIKGVEFIVGEVYNDEVIYSHKTLTQADFAVNDKITNSLSSLTTDNITSSESAGEYDYSGWVETPFNENIIALESSQYKSGIYLHILPIITEYQNEKIFNPSVIVAFSNSRLLKEDKINELLKKEDYYKDFSFGRSEIEPILICTNSIDDKKIPATNTTTIQHLIQYHTGPIIFSNPTVSELEPRFIVSKRTQSENDYNVVITPFVNINGNIGIDQSDAEKLYVYSDNYTINGNPIYFKVDKVVKEDEIIERNASSNKCVYVDAGFSKNYSSYITIPDGLNLTFNNMYVKSFTGTDNFDFSALLSENLFMGFGLWVKPKWDEKINKWVAEFKCSKSNDLNINDVFKFPSESDSESDSTTLKLKPWLLGWCEIQYSKAIGLIPQNCIITGDKKGSLTTITVDSQYERRENNQTYASEDKNENTNKSLQYVETKLGNSFDTDKAKVNDYTLELYNFSDITNVNCPEIETMFSEEIKNTGEETVTIVCRKETKNDDAKDVTIEYYNINNLIEGLSGGAKISGDSQVIEDEQKSITLSVDGDEKYYQLYNFDNGCANARLTSFYGADEQYEGETGNFYFNNVDMLVRVRPNEDSGDATELQYLDFSTLSAITIPTDTEVFTEAEKDGNVEHTQKSIQICYGQFENGSQYKCLQLYKMNETSDIENEYKSVVIEHQGNDPDDREKPYTQSLLPEGYEFVVRSIVEGCQGGTIHYMPLSVGVNMPGVDTFNAVDRLSKSIEWTGCDSGKDYLRLYNFAWNHCVTEYQPNYENEIQDDKFKLEDSDGILFRKSTVDDTENDNPELRYMTFKSLKNYINYEGDSNIVDDVDDEDKSESIERVYDEETHQEYFRLKDFKYRAGDIMLNGELESNSTTEFTDDDTHILVRQFDEYGHPVLKYAKLEISLPEINGGDYSYEINELYEIVNYLSGEISAISGTCSCDLSGAWQQGADAKINYGSSIGDSYRYEAINLDNRVLQGCWKHDGTFIIQGGDLLIPDGSINVGTVDSTYIGDGCIGVANINVRDSVYTQALTIGKTTISESQLQQLLALLN